MSKKTAKGPSKPQEPVSFRLRTARDLRQRDVITAHGPRTFLKPAERDSSELPEEYRNWLLVTLCDNEEVHRYCWAAIRPPRKVQWEIDAQAGSDGFFAPHNYVPATPEPAKFYQRKTGDAWSQGKPLGDAFGSRLNFLVRLSDCLEYEAMPGVQEWLLFSIATDSANTVEELMNACIQCTDQSVIRKGTVAMHGGSRSSWLIMPFAPLTFLAKQGHIAILKEGQTVPAIASVINTEEKILLDDRAILIMVAITSLPPFVSI
eukprot:s1136_g9.t1